MVFSKMPSSLPEIAQTGLGQVQVCLPLRIEGSRLGAEVKVLCTLGKTGE